MQRGAFASFLLVLPTYLLFLTQPSTHVSPWAHALAPIVLAALAFGAILAVFVLAFAVFGRDHKPSERWLTVLLSLPAVIAAGFVLFILANIPPT